MTDTQPDEALPDEEQDSGYDIPVVEPTPCLYAFLVFVPAEDVHNEQGQVVLQGGHAVADGNLARAITTLRPARLDDMSRSCQEIVGDVQRNMLIEQHLAAQVQIGQQMARQAQEQQQRQALLQNINLQDVLKAKPPL